MWWAQGNVWKCWITIRYTKSTLVCVHVHAHTHIHRHSSSSSCPFVVNLQLHLRQALHLRQLRLRQPLSWFPSLWISLHVLESYINEFIVHVLLIWLVLLCIIILKSKFLHLSRTYFLLLNGFSILWICCNLFSHSSLCGHLSCGLGLLQICYAHACTSFCITICFYFFWKKYSHGLAGSCGRYMFNFVRNCPIFSKIIMPLIFLTAVAQHPC